MALNAKVKVKTESNELNAEQWLIKKISLAETKDRPILNGFSRLDTIIFMEAYAKYRNGKA